MRKIGLAVFGVILGFTILNLALSAMLTGVMFPGVRVAGHSVAYKSRLQATEQLRTYDDQHTLMIQLADKRYTMKSSELGASRDTAASVEAAYSIGRRSALPVLGIVSSLLDGDSGYAYQLDSAQLNKFVRKVLADVGRPPVNAKVEVVEGQPVAIADKDGVSIDQAQLGRTLQLALAEGQDKSVALTPTAMKAEVRLVDTEGAITQAKKIIALDLSMTYNDRTFKPTGSEIAQWLVFPVRPNDKGVNMVEVDIDEAKLRGYVQSIANDVNVAPTNKKVTIKNGVTTVDREGIDGLALNQEEAVSRSLKALRSQQPTRVELSTSPVAFKTEYNRVTTLDVGRYIEINLSSQQLWVYQDGQVIYTSPVTSGATGMGFPTVTGLFSIYAKATNTWLDGRAYGEQYNYRVLVDYWMPFYGGFGMHDAWRWRSTFGGPDYYYNGSHGCVNLPLATAAFIYSWAEIGTPVWVHI